ncbi:MAG: SGNH/GDSL hydrolase family protein [Planctomycetota bacterium]
MTSGRRRKLVLALLLGVSLAVIAAEIAARTLFGTPWPERLPILRVEADPERGWRMVPNEGHYTYDRWVSVNELGLRGPDPAPKSPEVVRVLALGDSLVYGQGVGDAETMPVYLEDELNARDEHGRRWEVLNAGHRAYDTRQELALLEQLGPVLAPDVVVLFWFHNDLFGRDIESTYESLRASGPIAFDTGDRFEGFDRLRWRGRQLVRRSALVMWLYDLWLNPDAKHEVDPNGLEPRFATMGEQLERFLELEREGGFQLLFGVVPFGPALSAASDGQDAHWGQALEQRALRLARDKGIPAALLDQDVRALMAETGRPPIIPFDGHYLPEGNRALARSAASFVLGVL